MSNTDFNTLSDKPSTASAPSSASGPPPLVGPGGYGLQGQSAATAFQYPNGRQSDQWGQDDPALASARNYPGVDPNPMMPQPHPHMINNAMMGMGRMRWSGNAGNLASHSVYYQAAYLKALRQRRM